MTELYSCTAPNTWTKGASELRGDGNGDGRVSAADMVALARELSDDDGVQVEDTLRDPLGFQATVGVDANGDGRVDLQDSKATVRRIFAGG